MAFVHPTASIGSDVELGNNVHVGPACNLEGRVRLGDDVHLVGNVYLRGPLTIGPGTTIYPFACIGFPGQDVKFKIGDPTPGVVIGRNCTLREHVTIHAATHATLPTTIGDRVFMMVNSHAGHDAQVGSDVVFVNNASLGGHSIIADRVTLSGHSAVHQFVRVGRLAFISGCLGVSCDVPPFCVAYDTNRIASINRIGMRRAGMSVDEITATRRAFRAVFRRVVSRTEMLATLDALAASSPAVAEIAEFVRTAKRPICGGPGKPSRRNATDTPRDQAEPAPEPQLNQA
ncbi:MAG: acyl-ACP--UDP-N-acetylglucosamine O-acyltransferase [Phycisphaeraceae bacterium]|nr:acyl-ACP--UDP-N-acetylglucosamine O-acyltransferase [Phycisphaeraceae bacterium]MCW5763402.1 acyl-ACP--UDP-N-acetylglucosamine O-acyltransferase [Phycisphaeraceae bacterium]